MRDSELAARLALLWWCQLLLLSCILITFIYLVVLDIDVRLLTCELYKLSRKFPTLP
jgi:hypothetical protein